jgi:hypothetical protein
MSKIQHKDNLGFYNKSLHSRANKTTSQTSDLVVDTPETLFCSFNTNLRLFSAAATTDSSNKTTSQTSDLVVDTVETVFCSYCANMRFILSSSNNNR